MPAEGREDPLQRVVDRPRWLDEIHELAVDDMSRALKGIAERLEGPDDVAAARLALEDLALMVSQRVELDPRRLMTTGQAAQELGVGSINTVKKWVGDGLLDGYRVGSRIMVTRDSVDKFKRRPDVSRQRQFEAKLVSALRLLASDAVKAHLEASQDWDDERKPWPHADSIDQRRNEKSE